MCGPCSVAECRLVWLFEKAFGSFSPAGTENNGVVFYDISAR